MSVKSLSLNGILSGRQLTAPLVTHTAIPVPGTGHSNQNLQQDKDGNNNHHSIVQFPHWIVIMESQQMNRPLTSESCQSEQFPTIRGIFSMLKDVNGSEQNMPQNNSRKRPLEGQCTENDSSPRKAVKKENEKADDHLVMTENEMLQRARERMKKCRNWLAWKSATSKQSVQLWRSLKVKEELMASLQLRVNELEGVSKTDIHYSVKDDGQLTSTQRLLNIISGLEAENEKLSMKISDLEERNAALEKANKKRIESESLNNPQVNCAEPELVDFKYLISEQEKQIRFLKAQNDSFQHQLQEAEEKQVNERNLCKKIDDLQLKLIDEELEHTNVQIELTEQMANITAMVVIENKAPRQYDTELLQIIQDKMKSVSSSHADLKKLALQFPSLIECVVRDTKLKIEEAVRETAEMNKDLVYKYTKEAQLRKHYHNQLVELRGNIRVFCRIRPCMGESVMNVDPLDDGVIIVNNKGRASHFQMDKVLNMNVSQSQVFDEVSFLVRSAIDGFNVCIFAYGQTGSGKTHTMEGIPNDPGVNQRALQLLYKETESSGWKYQIETSMLEIYNETLKDLLSPEQNSSNLEVKMKPEGGFHVPGLVTVPVNSMQEINKIIETGRLQRATASTCMNERSSRSHSLLCVNVAGVNLITGSKTFGRLNLVDLAGSERVSRSQADGVHLKEAQNINKSLSSLGDVINALKNKHSHVPYRNSKLTYMLQESLGGDSKTLMILQVSPEEENLSESICTLSFGQRVRSAELGAAKKKFEDGNKGTPTSSLCQKGEIISPMSGTPSKRTPNTSKTSQVSSKFVTRLK